MNEKRPGHYLLSVEHIVSNIQMAKEADFVSHVIRNDMERKIATHIAGSCIEKVESAFQTSFRLKVYVLSPDELYELINREAQKIAYRPYHVDLGSGDGE